MYDEIEGKIDTVISNILWTSLPSGQLIRDSQLLYSGRYRASISRGPPLRLKGCIVGGSEYRADINIKFSFNPSILTSDGIFIPTLYPLFPERTMRSFLQLSIQYISVLYPYSVRSMSLPTHSSTKIRLKGYLAWQCFVQHILYTYVCTRAFHDQKMAQPCGKRVFSIEMIDNFGI